MSWRPSCGAGAFWLVRPRSRWRRAARGATPAPSQATARREALSTNQKVWKPARRPASRVGGPTRGGWVSRQGRRRRGSSPAAGPSVPAPGRPAVAGPGVARPAVARPAIAGPGVARPAVARPAVARPAAAGPGVAGPSAAGPAVAGRLGGRHCSRIEGLTEDVLFAGEHDAVAGEV